MGHTAAVVLQRVAGSTVGEWYPLAACKHVIDADVNHCSGWDRCGGGMLHLGSRRLMR
jgi:hypothetical protein